MKIWTVDAFAKQPFRGNPAAVAIVPEFPSDEMCQLIAAEMNLSETAFLKKLHRDHFHLRWFTPKVEVKLCGHATLASAHILFQEGLIEGEEITFETLSGPLKVVSLSLNNYRLDFPLQKTGAQIHPSSIEHCFKQVRQAVMAHGDLIVEVESEEVVRNYVPQFSALEEIDARGIILTARGHPPYDFVSRFFVPREGIDEDPVTGSAHCKLAHFWQQQLHRSEFLAYQASARGGEIKITIVGERAHLVGQAVTMLKGTLQVL